MDMKRGVPFKEVDKMENKLKKLEQLFEMRGRDA